MGEDKGAESGEKRSLTDYLTFTLVVIYQERENGLNSIFQQNKTMTIKELVFASLFVEKHKELEKSGSPCTDGNCIEEAYRYAEECAEEFGRLLEEEKPRGEDMNKYRPIEDVITEISRMDKERQRVWAMTGCTYKPNNGGFAARLDKIFRRTGIKTLDDLLKTGKRGLRRTRQVGKKTLQVLDMALSNLYGIKDW